MPSRRSDHVHVHVHEGVAIVERRLVEDGDALATLLVDHIRPHAVVRGDLLPAGRKGDFLEQRIAVDDVAELEAQLGELGLHVDIAGAVDLGRQDLAVDDLTLAARLHLQNHVARIASPSLCIHGTEQVQERVVGGRVFGGMYH